MPSRVRRRRLPRIVALIAVVLMLGGTALLGGCASDSSDRSSGTQSSQVLPLESPTSRENPEVEVPVTPSGGWQIPAETQASDDQWGAYTGASAVLPGQPLTIHTSASGPVTASAYRIGGYGGAGAALVGSPLTFTAQGLDQTPLVDATLRAPYVDWPAAASMDTTGWPAGLYLLNVSAEGSAVNVPFTMVSENIEGTVVFIAGDTTWAAYNDWGGRSLYGGPGGFADRSYGASFDRPYAQDWQIWYEFDVPIVRVLEDAGVPIGYTTVSALAQQSNGLRGAAGAISNGHDEYWPVSYRQALVDARDTGTNLAFLGANAGYWRVRIEQGVGGPGRMVVGYKDAGLDPVKNSPETTVRLRDEPAAMPEVDVIGQLYDCFPARGDATITEPSFFLFADTGVGPGSTVPGLIGIESDRAFARADTPRPIQVPALSRIACKDSVSYSTMTYYGADSGAGVFATGTMNWGPALAGARRNGLTESATAFTTTVTTNLARQMAQGPMARSHPPSDDYAVIAGLPQNTFAN